MLWRNISCKEKTSLSHVRLAYWLAWAMIGALAFLIMEIEVPIIPGFDYLKMDFSDSLVALSTLVFGPLGGTMIALFKSLLSLFISGFNPISMIGQLAAFLASLAYILPFYFISKKHEDKAKYQIFGLIVGTLALTVVNVISKLFRLTPMYISLMGFKLNSSLLTYVVSAIIPFNLIKGLINSIVVLILAKTLLPVLEKFVKRNF
ncbi:integral membrane protein [Lactobacillus gasseri]|uniref:ECF transporter S component n=1 Tax=Lactobacillus gasseri TaxID=1596 RepID=UPI000E087F0C|nr:ECF transporter S component [Lactobacillus gasseri]STX21037.1 integral membrane protein [Lactobacillus gasseri]